MFPRCAAGRRERHHHAGWQCIPHQRVLNRHVCPAVQLAAVNAITVPLVNAYRSGVLSNAGAQAVLTFLSGNPAASRALSGLGEYTAALGPVLTTATVRRMPPE